jgi:predicted ATPase
MISSFRVRNFKSLLDVAIEPGHFNVFIGANGCGKTNVLESFALMAGAMTDRTTPEDLYNRGYRVARPATTRSAFADVASDDTVELTLALRSGEDYEASLLPADPSAIDTRWFDQRDDLPLLDVRLSPGSGPQQVPLFARSRWAARLDPKSPFRSFRDFAIYTPGTLALRGIQVESRRTPVGIHGEGVDLLVASLSAADRDLLIERLHVIDWLDDLFVDPDGRLKFEGHKLGRSVSNLYFHDRFMRAENNVFSVENANEGILHLLFHLAVFVSPDTPRVFAIDNLETALNPQLCRLLTKSLAELSVERGKQAFVTTHNPAVLDGLNLRDDRQRLFIVSRDGDGHTQVKRLASKPALTEGKYKLSELWMRGHLGGLPDAF